MDRRSKPYYYLSQADVEHDDTNSQGEGTEEDLARFLIGILCQTNGKQTLKNIIGKKYRSLANFGIVTVDRLREFVKKYPRSFCISDTGSEDSDSDSRWEVEVTTAVTVCPLHVKRYGSCPDDSECGSLHVCKFYVLTGKCEFNNHTCHYGHKLRTDHNNSILKRLLLDHLPTVDLRMLLKRQKARTQCTRPKICHFYNSLVGCSKGVNCSALHICKRFVLDTCKFGDSCRRSHDLLDPTVIFILNQYAVDLVDLSALLWDNEKTHAVVRNTKQKNRKPERGGSGQKSFPTLFSKRRGYLTGEPDSKVLEDHSTNTGEDSLGAGYKTPQTSEVYSKPHSSSKDVGKHTSYKGVSKSSADVFPFSASSVNLPSKAQIFSRTLTLGESASSRQAVTVSSHNQDEHTHQSSQETHLSFTTSIGQKVTSIGQNLSRPVASVPPQIYKRAEQCSETETGRIRCQSPGKVVRENVECVKNTGVQQKLPHAPLSRTETTEQPGTSSGFADARESLKSIISNLISDMQKLHSINAEMSGPESHFVSYLSALAEPVKLEEELQAAHNECLEKGTPAQPEVFKNSPNRARHLSEGEITDSESDIGEDQKKVSGLSPIVISSTSTLSPAVNSSSTSLETEVFSGSLMKEKVFVDYHHALTNSPATAISNTMPNILSAGYKTEKDPVESIKTCDPSVHILSDQSAISSRSKRKHVRQEPLKKPENYTSSGKIMGDELECIESPENSLSDISVESCTNSGVRKASTDVTSGEMVDASDVPLSNMASTGRPRTFIYLNPDKFAVVNYSQVVSGRNTDTRVCGQSWNKLAANASVSCSDLERGQTFEHHLRSRKSQSDTVIKEQNINFANDISLEEISSGEETLKQGHTFSSNLHSDFVGPSNQDSQTKFSHNRNDITKPLEMQPLHRAPETLGFRCHPGEAINFEQDTCTPRAGKHKMINTDDQYIGLVDEVEVYQGFKTFRSHLQRTGKRRGSSPEGRTGDHCLRKSPVQKAQSSHEQPGNPNRKNCSPERKRSCLQTFSGGVPRARERISSWDIKPRTDKRAKCRLSEHSESPNKDGKYGYNNTKYSDEPVQSKPKEFLSRSHKDDHSSSGERSHNEFRPSSSGERSSRPDASLNDTHFNLGKFFRQEQRSGEISQRSVEFSSRYDEKQAVPARSFRSDKFSRARPKQSSRQDARSGERSPRSGDRSSRQDERSGSDDKKVTSNKYYRYKAEHIFQQKERSGHDDENSHMINELLRERDRHDDRVVHNHPDGRQSERPLKQFKNQTYKRSHLPWEANGQHTFKRLSRDRDRQRSGSPQRLFSHKPDSSSSGQAGTRQDFPVRGLSPPSRERNQSPYLHSRQMPEDVRETDRDLRSRSQDRLLHKSNLDQLDVFKGNFRDSSRRRLYQKHNHAFEQQQKDDNIHDSFIEQDVEDYDWEGKEGFSRRNSIRNRLGPSPDCTEVVVKHTLIRKDFAVTPFEDSELQKNPLEITEHNHYGRFSNYQEWEKMDKRRRQKEVGLSEREIVLKYGSSQSEDETSHTRPVDSYIQREREIGGERFSPQREFSREDNMSLGQERPFSSSTGLKVERKVSRENDFSERSRKRQHSSLGIMCYKPDDRSTSFADSFDDDKSHEPVKKFKFSHSVFKKDIEEKHYRKNNYSSWASAEDGVDRLDDSSGELESDRNQEDDQWLGEHQEAFLDRRERRTFDAREKLSNRRVQQPVRGRRPVRERLGQRRNYEDLAESQLMASNDGEEPQHPYWDYGKEDGEEGGLEDETEIGDDMCVNEVPGGHNTDNDMDEAEDDLEQGEPKVLAGTRGRSRGFRGPVKFSYFRGRGQGSWRARGQGRGSWRARGQGRGHLKPDLRSMLINRSRSKILSTAKTEGLQIRLKRKTPTPEREQESRYEDSSGREVVMNVQDY